MVTLSFYSNCCAFSLPGSTHSNNVGGCTKPKCALADSIVIESRRLSLGRSFGSSSFFFLLPVTCFCGCAPAVYGRLKGSLLLSLSLWSSKQSPPASQPEPKLTSRLHFQQVPPFITRQGCWRGWGGGVRGVRQGASKGAVCVPLTPPLFFSTGCWEYRPLPQTAATLLSYNPYNGAPNLFRGGETCSLLLLPCSLTLVSCPLLFCFFLCVAVFPWLPSLIPYPSPSSLPWSLSPVSPHWGIIPPTLFHQSWARRLGCPDSREEVAAYPSACPGLANEKRGAEVLIHNNSH